MSQPYSLSRLEDVPDIFGGKYPGEMKMLAVGAGSAVRIAPGTVRSVWNERPEDAELAPGRAA